MNRKLENDEFVEVDVEIRIVTEKAVFIHDGSRSEWIPKSQIEDPPDDELEVGKHVTLLIPRWLAEEKGIV